MIFLKDHEAFWLWLARLTWVFQFHLTRWIRFACRNKVSAENGLLELKCRCLSIFFVCRWWRTFSRNFQHGKFHWYVSFPISCFYLALNFAPHVPTFSFINPVLLWCFDKNRELDLPVGLFVQNDVLDLLFLAGNKNVVSVAEVCSSGSDILSNWKIYWEAFVFPPARNDYWVLFLGIAELKSKR